MSSSSLLEVDELEEDIGLLEDVDIELDELDEYLDHSHVSTTSISQDSLIVSQLRAVLHKNIALHKRQRKTIFCQVLFPALLILFIAAMQMVVEDIVPSTSREFIIPSKVQLYPQSFHYTGDLDFYNRYWIVDNTNNLAGQLTTGNEQQGLLGNITQYSYMHPNWYNITSCPYFENKNSADEAENDIFNLFTDLNQYSAHHIAKTYLLFECPDGVVILNQADITSGNLNFDIMYNDNIAYVRREKMRLPNKFRYEVNSLLHTIQSAFSRQSNASTVTASMQGFPYWKAPLIVDLNDVVGPMLIPFALTFLIPVFMHTIVLEKENRVREMMKMMGLGMPTYWIINYLFDYVLYSMVLFLFIILEYIVKVRMVTQSSITCVLVFFIIWGFTQVSFSFTLSSFFSKSSLSTVLGYLIVVISVTAGFAINQFLFPDPNSLPWAFYIWPLFVFERAIFLMYNSCKSYHCPTPDSLFDFSTEYPQLLIILIVQAILLMILAIYLDKVLPGTYGVPDHPLFCFKKRSEKFNDKKKIPTSDRYGWYEDNEEDTDVILERDEVNNGKEGTIIIKDLQKLYNSSDVLQCNQSQLEYALKGIHLAIKDGECFGLLGPNGAGKTTLISILTGLYSPSFGTAFILDKDIRTSMNEIRQSLGICPQFDIQWDSLTPYEHVVFYSRLKGVSSSNEKSHVMSLLSKVGLDDCANSKYACQLSGGMRRRLSVAMALAGNPKIVFFDEPTSGLDPISKRQLWDIVSSSKENRSMILTTHSMEEADILCDRISILSSGKLKCLGTPLHLKNKFGFGYRLYVCAEKGLADSVQTAESFILSVIKDAKIIEQYQYNIVFQIPVEYQSPIKLTKIFSKIELQKEEHKIEQWGITQTR